MQTNEGQQDRHKRREASLLSRYGEIMDLQELAEELKYPTAEALRQAYYKSHAPVALKKIPHRSGLYAATRAVADYLSSFDDDLSAI